MAGITVFTNAFLIDCTGKEPIDPTQPFQPRGVPDETIGVNVDCSSVVDRKRAAIRERRSGPLPRRPE